MRNKYFALLTLTVTSTLMSCGSNSYSPKKYFSLYTYRQSLVHGFYNQSTAPNSGDVKLLVIPMWFTDSSNYIYESKKDDLRSDIQKAFFGTPEEIGWHSVSSYYELDSFGKSHISGDVANWYNVGKPSTDYYSTECDMEGLLFAALEWYKSDSGQSKLTNFDGDSDGFLDGVAFIYAVPDSTNLPSGSGADNLWGYTTWEFRTMPNVSNPTLKNYFWASYDFMYDAATATQRTGHSYHRGDNAYASVDAHCYIHEFGHNYGLPDYYDYSYQNSFAGGFSMQDSNVGAHDGYSRYALGWADAYIPEKSCTIKLKPMEDAGECIILAQKFNQSCFSEYILLEYYTPTRLNKADSEHQYLGRYPMGSTRPGIRIWHVDARLAKYNSLGAYKGLTDDPTKSYVYPATNNNTVSDYTLDERFHTLVLMRNDVDASYEYGYEAIEDDLFYAGDTFSLSKFKNQFPNKTKMNDGSKFTWTITIENITSEYATIKLAK